MRPYATRCQKGAANAGMFFAPKTRIGLVIRNLMYAALTSRWLSSTFVRMVKAAATDLRLKYADPDHALHADLSFTPSPLAKRS